MSGCASSRATLEVGERDSFAIADDENYCVSCRWSNAVDSRFFPGFMCLLSMGNPVFSLRVVFSRVLTIRGYRLRARSNASSDASRNASNSGSSNHGPRARLFGRYVRVDRRPRCSPRLVQDRSLKKRRRSKRREAMVGPAWGAIGFFAVRPIPAWVRWAASGDATKATCDAARMGSRTIADGRAGDRLRADRPARPRRRSGPASPRAVRPA